MSIIYHGGAGQRGGKYSSITPPSPDIYAKVSSADSTASYLNSKIVVSGSGISKSILNPGANEQLQLLVNTPTLSEKRYFLHFGTGGALGVETFVNSTTAGTLPGSVGIGHYIRAASHIKSMQITIPKFISYDAAHYTRFQLKSLVCDGSRTADSTSATGTNSLNYDFTFPVTGGSYKYHIGKNVSGLNLVLNAGEMLFIVICSMTVNTALGASIQVEIQED